MLNQEKLLKEEEKYLKIKCVLGSKIAEARVFAGFPKRTYNDSIKSGNLLFKTESGESLPNEDTLRYYIDLYQVSDKNASLLYELWREGKKTKSKIIRLKRGWETK